MYLIENLHHLPTRAPSIASGYWEQLDGLLQAGLFGGPRLLPSLSTKILLQKKPEECKLHGMKDKMSKGPTTITHHGEMTAALYVPAIGPIG